MKSFYFYFDFDFDFEIKFTFEFEWAQKVLNSKSLKTNATLKQTLRWKYGIEYSTIIFSILKFDIFGC